MRKILIIGLSNIDIITSCTTYPQEDTDEKCEGIYIQRGGKSCEFLGSLGQDWIGTLIAKDLDQLHIDSKNCPIYDQTYNSPSSVVIINTTDGTRTIRHYNPGFPELTCAYFENKINKKTIANYSWIHFEGRRKNLDEIFKMICYTLINQKPSSTIFPFTPFISVEVEKPSDLTWPHFSTLNINLYFIGKDYAKYRGFSNMNETVTILYHEMLNKSLKTMLDHDPIIISTWGELGSCALLSTSQSDTLSSHYSIIECPPIHALSVNKPLDTLGAGDAFIAAFIHSLHSFEELQQNDDPKWLKFIQDANNLSERIAYDSKTTVQINHNTKVKIVKICLDYANYIAGLKCAHIGLTNLNIPISFKQSF
ncbi:ketohexokinase-like isoform X2 [Gordionus sp. m RMFG-2023]|uniref:ketohexokinase-like isoform X2 n=1 Tax=Gordionus sp. m RMFG-2023 TaxID=3053472 RepID=UPI0031FE13E0